MLVNHTPEGWEVIHQRAHGMLAVQLASHWKAADRPLRWLETLLAIAEHDDAQDEWQDHNHLNENGTPMNFDQQVFSFTQMKRIASCRSAQNSRWVARSSLSKHLTFSTNAAGNASDLPASE
jgi:hypothetical protein